MSCSLLDLLQLLAVQITLGVMNYYALTILRQELLRGEEQENGRLDDIDHL